MSLIRLQMALPHYRTILLLAALAACSRATPPEEAVLAWLEEAETAAEERDRKRLVDVVSENYLDARGNDRAAIDETLRFLFLRNRNIVLTSNVEELTIVDATAAKVILTAAMAGTNDGAFGFGADVYRFELELMRDGGEWLLIGARWGEAGRPRR
jgi:hypothetical protein